MKKVSVIIPTYNREKTLLRAVQSVLDQTYTNLEVLVIDDGSTDGTAELVNGIRDDRVQYIVLEKNGGPANARNIGVEMASGEWIAFQDSDDCWHKNKLEKQMRYAAEHPEYSLIYCMYNAIMQDGHCLTVPAEPWPEQMEGNMFAGLLERNVIGTPTILVKREAFIRCGGFSTEYNALEDWEFAVRFAKEHLLGFVSEVLMDAYMLKGGVSSNLGAHFDGRCRMLVAYKKEMMELGVFNTVMVDILKQAQRYAMLEPVKKLMMVFLTQNM